MIFNKSLNDGEIPQDWKKANVTAVFKKGAKHCPLNYRPISLTSIVCKLLESIIKDHVMEHLLINNLVCPNQHGFVPQRSCLTQQVDVLDAWTKAYDQGKCIDVAFLDIKKAYDTLPHKPLLVKLKTMGFETGLLKWIEAFLSNRKQRVVVNDKLSGWASVTSGVPQGSVIGPILFLCYINDMPQQIKNEFKLFADDAKLFAYVKHQSDCESLQNDINSLADWSKKWQLEFHPLKSSILRIGKHPPEFTYYINDKTGSRFELKQSNTAKDLGVLLDEELNFSKHVDCIVNDANRLVGLLRRSLLALDKKSFVILFKTLIRPKLEYNNSVWYPNYKGDFKKLEGVQRRATKMLPGMSNLSYTDRLKALDLPTISYRRRRGDLIQVYKYLNDHYNVDWSNLFELVIDPHYLTRGHKFKLYKCAPKSKMRENFFTVRVVNDWNSLPENVVCSPSVNAFKNALDDHWKALPIKFDPDA